MNAGSSPMPSAAPRRTSASHAAWNSTSRARPSPARGNLTARSDHLAIRLPDKPSSPYKVTLEHLGHSVIGKQNPHHEHRPLSSFDVEVHGHTVMVIEPFAKLAHRIGKCPTSQGDFHLAHSSPILHEAATVTLWTNSNRSSMAPTDTRARPCAENRTIARTSMVNERWAGC